MWVYILKSKLTNKYYIGQTINIEKRLEQHNSGLSRWTKLGIPWQLEHKEYYKTRNEAIRREKKLKSYKSGNALKKLLGGVA